MARLISRYENTPFTCDAGHLTKVWCWNNAAAPPCGTCQQPTVRLYGQRSDNAQRFDPVVVARNPKTGEVRHVAGPQSRLPRGFVREELRTRAEIDRACRQLDRQDAADYDRSVIREQMGRAGYQDPYRDYRPQTEVGARLEQAAREMASRDYGPRYSERRNFVQAMEYDRSNRRD